MSRRTRRKYVPTEASEIEVNDDDYVENMRAFSRYLKNLDRSPYTITYYEQRLTHFMYSLEEMRLKTNLRAITGPIIEDEYIRYAYDKKRLKHASVTSTLRALRAFFNWAVGRNIISESPLRGIVVGESKPADVETFSRDQIYALFSQPDPKLFIGLRDLTIMSVFLDTGVRVRELCDIKVSDVMLPDDRILIRGKNKRDRVVPIQANCRRILTRYLRARGNSPVDWLFISVDDRQMNRDSVRRRTEKYGRQAGITDVRCSPHTFRHTFAKMSVQNGADLFSLQKVLGHETLDMVRRYVNMFGHEVQEAHKRFSPLENLNIRL